MVNRRKFVLAAGTAAVVGTAQAAEPAAIAALKNRRGDAQPISTAERQARIERARVLMRQNKIEAIALAGGTSLEYFTGIRWGNSERLFTAVLPQLGNPIFVAPGFEEDRVRERLIDKETKILIWQEDDDPYALVAKGLRDAGITSGKVGVEETVKFVFTDGIRQGVRGVDVVSATPITAGCRSIKSAAELKLMQLANDITLAVYEASWKSFQPGMTNRQFTDLISAGYRQSGFNGSASCQVDEYSALPHGSLQPQVIKEGSIVLIDDGCLVEGYQSDISRTFVVGKATDKMKRVFDVVHAAQKAALNAAKPGVQCGSVDAAARKVVDDAGFGPGYTHFTHRVGHGIGMDMHEWPYLVKGNTQLLEANMTTSDEPGIYIRGEFGIRLEDDMYVTPDGAKWFTPQSNSITEPFAR